MAHPTPSADHSVLEGTFVLDGAGLRSATPAGTVLSNGRLTSVILSTGATRLTFDGLAVNRWRRYFAHGAGTSRIYLRDLERARSWNVVGLASKDAPDDARRVVMAPGSVRFEQRLDDAVSVATDIFVAVDADLEVRRVTLRNDGDLPRRFDVTSCVEIVLGPHAGDTSHPAFAKLFVQTSFDPATGSIQAWRRLRSPDERPARFVHACTGDGRYAGFETSRFAFIGRGRSLDRPRAMDRDATLEGLTGSVLDPVAVLRRSLDVAPGQTVSVDFFSGVAREESEVATLMHSIGTFTAGDERRAAAATELGRQLLGSIEPRQAGYFRRLASALFVDDRRLRAPSDLVARLDTPTARLVELGLDPALPLVVIRISGQEDLPLVRSMLRAHRYWRSLGLSVNLYVLNDVSDTDAAESLQAMIERATDSFEAPVHVRGGVYSDYSDDMLAGDQLLLQSHASIVIRDELPSLEDDRSAVHLSPRFAAPAAESMNATALPPLDLAFPNGYGGFTRDGDEYVIDVPFVDGDHVLPPQPWVNVLANEDFGCTISETGGGYTWSQNSRENRLTPWSNDAVADPPSERVLVEDSTSGRTWSLFPGEGAAPTGYRVRHGFGYTVFESVFEGIRQVVTIFVDRSASARVVRVDVTNESAHERDLRIVGAQQLTLGPDEEASPRLIHLERFARNGAIVARNRSNGEFRERAVFSAMFGEGVSIDHWSTDRFDLPYVAAQVEDSRDLSGSVVVHAGHVRLGSGARAVVHLLLGDAENDDALRPALNALTKGDRWATALDEVKAFWRELLGGVRICTPAPEIDFMVNGWLPYQNLACRMWGRSAFYQSGGAYGYRDQLQDSSSMLLLDPSITRRQIMLHAEQQFEEGDVMHWWHPPTGKGIRTRFSDDLLWLPYITATYVASTGDHSVLDEQTTFIAARKLEIGEDEVFVHPERLGRSATVYEHCCLAIDRSMTRGANGLPLIGTGDWNDGMNRVGREGKGESVWLGFFIATIIDQMLPICERRGDGKRVDAYRAYREHLQHQLNDTGWDGEWYRRAYYDNGAVLGSKESDEGKIDALAQAWAVISGVAPPDRATSALDAMERELVDEEVGIIRLLKPAFDRTPNDPGYIKGYVPGVRENGGQYTHAALWAVRALAEAGRTERAARLLAMLSPISQSSSREAADTYRVEPYVIAADVYGEPPHVGRGGWTWYTGSAGWMYRVMLESILGFRVVDGNRLELNPSVPTDWNGFSIRYRVPREKTVYDITVRSEGRARLATLDDEPVETSGSTIRIPLRHDGKTHRLVVQI